MKLSNLLYQRSNPSCSARQESVIRVWTNAFRLSFPRGRTPLLVVGALIFWVGSGGNTEAGRGSKTHRHAPRRHGRRVPPPVTPGVAYHKAPVGPVTAHVVQVDLNRSDIRVTVGVASGGIGRHETWSGIINRLRPTAAITGTYYDPATF